jgi:hypothetical protein
MNPDPPADQVVERIHPLPGFTKEVREEDRVLMRGRTLSKSTILLVARS